METEHASEKERGREKREASERHRATRRDHTHTHTHTHPYHVTHLAKYRNMHLLAHEFIVPCAYSPTHTHTHTNDSISRDKESARRQGVTE